MNIFCQEAAGGHGPLTKSLFKRAKRFAAFAFCALCVISALTQTAIGDDGFMDAISTHWVVEQLGKGSVEIHNGTLEIRDQEGCTVWLRQKLRAPVVISYEVAVIDEGGPFDRVSDLNCFWMASDPAHPGDLFRGGHPRTGAFPTYDALQTYYVGYGGNHNRTSRFRRYLGDGNKPLLPQYDLRAPQYLLRANHYYRIELEAIDGVARFKRDGETIFEYTDPRFLAEGWFAFRTVKSHLKIRNFKVQTPQ